MHVNVDTRFHLPQRMTKATITTKTSVLSISLVISSCLLLLSSSLVLTNAKANKQPLELTEKTWTRLLEGEWMVDFYAPWCPACKVLKPEWKRFASGWSDELNIKVASVDVTANPGLSGRFMVSGLPTIYHVKDGVFRLYNGPREEQALVMFVEGFKWRSIEPISWWRAPNSLQMSFVAFSFQISMLLRDLHNHLVDEVGLPYYVSYGLFAVSTVILGILLGLIIVFLMDFILGSWSSGPSASVSAASARRKKTDGDENRGKKQQSSDLEEEEEEGKSRAESKSTEQTSRKRPRQSHKD